MRKIFATLYARDSAQRIKEWNIETISNRIIISHGLLEGKKQTREILILEGKNIGKQNETSPSEQAFSEAQSRWNNQRREGYKTLFQLGIITNVDEVNQKIIYEYEQNSVNLLQGLEAALPINNTDKDNRLKPMKAQPYYKDNGSPRIKFPCIGQPKINGIRCTARLENDKVVLTSKKGLYYNVPIDVIKALNKYFDYEIDLDFDGELYIPNFLLQDIKSAATKLNINTSLLEYHIFDLAIENYTQEQRLDILKDIIVGNSLPIVLVESIIINSKEEAEKFCDDCIKRGYEGAIFRDLKAEYQFGKRPQTMVKLKRRESKEFKIVDIIPMDKEPDLGIFVCQNDINNRTFKVVSEGSKEVKREYLENREKYIGLELTVEFYERTKDEIPFHAIGITIRDYE